MGPVKMGVEWNIKCHADKLYSDYICIDGFQWLIHIFPNNNKLSCLLVPGDLSDLPQFWTRLECFKLALIDQTNGQKITAEEYQHKYTQGMHDWHWGCERFINLSKLPNTHGFIKNDTCIFEADISVTSRDERANHACQVASKPATSVKMEPDKLSFGWNIKCHADKLYSEYICTGGFRWLILIFPNANKLSCLLVPGDLSDLPQFWTKLEYFKLTLIDQTNGQKITAEEYQHCKIKVLI
ncbi:ubiquitin C-terminal hydrolase 12-like [Lotus japonicus]|uniref:ubiquitin C-terminal hydrolase 12-like n=1 Tax=Lotus japonicus TaxID=34305 RepID=UPI002586EE4F|nr:ubiquitin C-terminal hydrolase 12-like [Lotus japonicus]